MKKVLCLFLMLCMLLFTVVCIAEETTEKVGLSAPWTIYMEQVKALFDPDPDIRMVYDEAIDDSVKEIKLFVENSEKADAITKLLPAEQNFGGVTLKVTVIPANAESEDRVKLLETAFNGNPVISYIKTFATPFGNQTYIVFQNKVVQYFSDNMQDINGFTSTLYQEIAREIFGVDGGVYFCTDVPTE